ncbi:MAG: STAS domain-containing protein [Chitinispirillaceae bacterium]|nr:STAS domain-containing protein [Chitinispirillaceae bacterium]
MDSHSSHNVSEEMYHRIYRLKKRGLSAHTIAATLHLPLRAVLNVISRFEKAEALLEKGEKTRKKRDNSQQEFLDIYFYPKTRYGIIDIVGTLSDGLCEVLQEEFKKIFNSTYKAVGIKMSEVSFISQKAAEILKQNKKIFESNGRFLAILDPSTTIEPLLANYNIDKEIPIFGTEHAFEEAAFSRKRDKI